jgi:hypothetical protein
MAHPEEQRGLVERLKAVREQLLTQAAAISDVIRIVENSPELEKAFRVLKQYL